MAKFCQNIHFLVFFCGLYGVKKIPKVPKNAKMAKLCQYSIFFVFLGGYRWSKKIQKVPKSAKMAKFCQNSHFLGGIGGKKKLKFFCIESWNPNAKKNYKIIMELKNYSTTIDKII